MTGQTSTPKSFKIHASTNTSTLVDGNEKTSLGEFTLFQTATTESIFSQQYFQINPDNQSSSENKLFSVFEIDFLSNHGNQDFTCIYQIKVHGSVGNSEIADSFGFEENTEKESSKLSFIDSYFGS